MWQTWHKIRKMTKNMRHEKKLLAWHDVTICDTSCNIMHDMKMPTTSCASENWHWPVGMALQHGSLDMNIVHIESPRMPKGIIEEHMTIYDHTWNNLSVATRTIISCMVRCCMMLLYKAIGPSTRTMCMSRRPWCNAMPTYFHQWTSEWSVTVKKVHCQITVGASAIILRNQAMTSPGFRVASFFGSSEGLMAPRRLNTSVG